jgi:hypothetical protein
MNDPRRRQRGTIDFSGILRKGNRLGAAIETGAQPNQIESAKLVLNMIAAAIRSNVGADEDPSELLVALTTLPDIEPEGVELGQDVALLAAELVETVRDNLDNPEALPFLIPAAIGIEISELKDDVEALG